MVAYTDVPAVNSLYQEQEQVSMAISAIDAGGKVSNFTVMPPLPEPGAAMGMPIMMPVMITVPDPPPSLMDQARAALVIRQNAIVAELTALGVTESPAAFGAQSAERAKR
jgi:hypothetical protein